MVAAVGDALRFMETITASAAQPQPRDFYTSHEALLLPTRKRDAAGAAAWGWFNLSTHFPGSACARRRWTAPTSSTPRHPQSGRGKLGPS